MTRAEREGQTAAALVDQAKAGDPEAFAALVRRYRKRIFALALHLSGSRSDADDITQDVFMRAYRALAGFEGKSEFFTWVYRITVNRALNARRDRDRRGELPMDDERLELALKVDAQDNPRRALELRQLYAQLLRALDGLSVELRTTVVLVALQGLSHGEAAVVQKCSVGTVSWRMHEARARLVAAMEPKLGRRARPVSPELSEALAQAGFPLWTLATR